MSEHPTTPAAGWGTNHYLRDQIEQVIKDRAIDRARFHEVPKQQWRSIIENAVSAFTSWDGHRRDLGDLHWVWNRIKKPCFGVMWGYEDQPHSAELFARFIADPWVYVFVEDLYDKMWVYEVDPALLADVLPQTCLEEYLVASKKYEWLLGEDHNGGIFAHGELAVEWLQTATRDQPKRWG